MEFNNNMPIYVQVMNEIKKEMIKGQIQLGEKLPSARDLAIKYQINPNTSNRIYRELELMQLCFTKRGLGTFVTEDKTKLTDIRKEMADDVIAVFLKEMIDLGFTKEEITKVIEQKYEEFKGEVQCYQQEM